MPPISEHTNRLRVERKARKWSQAELAALVGVTQPDISLYERGLVPSAMILRSLGRAFGVRGATVLRWLREPAEECA